MHTRVSVVIAFALALGSTSPVLAQSSGDGGPFDAGDFHGTGFGGDGHRESVFDRDGYHRDNFQGGGFGLGGTFAPSFGRAKALGLYRHYPSY